MMMDIITCPFCKGTETAREACEECDEDGLFDLPDHAAYAVNTLTGLIKRAAHEGIGGMVIVIENHDGSVVESYGLGYTMRSKGSDTLERIAKNSRKAWEDARIKKAKAKLEARWLCRIGRNKDGKLVKMNDGTAEARKYGNAVYWAAHLYYEDYDIMHSLCELARVTFGLAQKADEEDMSKRCELCDKAWDTLLDEQKNDDGH